MIRCFQLATLALALVLPGVAQKSDAADPQSSPAATQKQQNAASAGQDTSSTSGDQITKPTGAKGSTLIGCLSGPDKEGKYTLVSMSHRSGVQILGPDDLKNDSGSKVKLSGVWQPDTRPVQKGATTTAIPRFQVTDVEVISQACKPPSETTPVSKNKRQKTTTYDAPGSENPK